MANAVSEKHSIDTCANSVYLRNPEDIRRYKVHPWEAGLLVPGSRSIVRSEARRLFESINNGFPVDRVSECAHGLPPVSPDHYGHLDHQHDTGEGQLLIIE